MKRDVEKLKMLLPHWIRHNEEHKNEYKACYLFYNVVSLRAH